MLAIETSNPSSWTPAQPVMPGVALGRRTERGVEVLSVQACDPRSRDDELMLAIDRAFATGGAERSELGTIAVSVGPGGFTAVRIAVTVAKMLAEATGAAVVPVPSACVAAMAVGGEGPFAVVLASKGADAYVTRFESADDAVRGGLGRIMTAEELDGLGLRTLVADGFLPAAMSAWAGGAGVQVEPLVLDPRRCLELASLAEADPLALSPIYPRIPEAVRKWRELHPDR